MAVFCRHCGNAVAAGTTRCASCGALLQQTPPPPRPNGRDAALRLPQETPDELLRQALQLMAEGDCDDAILLCRRAIALDPQKVAAYTLLGELYERVGETERARRAYEQALAIDAHYEPARLGKERLSAQPLAVPAPPPTSDTTTTDAAVPLTAPAPTVWSGHPVPLLAATALVVTSLFLVRTIVPPPASQVRTPSLPPPILVAPAPNTPMPPPTPAPEGDAVRKGLDALNRRDYDGAIRWFTHALHQNPQSNEARSWLLLARAMKEERRMSAPSTPLMPPLPRAPSSPAPATPSLPDTPSSPPPTTTPLPAWQWQRPAPPPTVPPALAPQPSPPATPPFTPPHAAVQPSAPSAVPDTAPSHASAGAPSASTAEDWERYAIQQALDGNLAAAAEAYRMALARLNDSNREGYLRQQLALTLQRLGRYEEAAAEYERAIAAYRKQIERGVQVDAAQRGIEACQRGLEICRRSP